MNKKQIVLLVLFVVFITLGMPDALISSSWNQVRADFGVRLSFLGMITFTSYIMIITSIGIGPKILSYTSEKWMALTGVLLSSIALLLMSQINAFVYMVLLAVFLGFGRGLVDYSINHYATLHANTKQVNYLHSMFGVGVIIAPFVMAYALRDGAWRTGFLLIGFLFMVISLILISSLRFFESSTEDEHKTRLPIKEIFKIPGVKLTILIFIIITHVESLGSVWIASYFFVSKGVSVSEAAIFTTIFFVGLTASRLSAGFFSDHLSSKQMLLISFTNIIIAGVTLTLNSELKALFYVSTFLYGFGIGPLFPNMMNINNYRFERKHISQIISLEMGIGFMGFGILTPLMGLLLDGVSIELFKYQVIILGVLLFILFRTLNKKLPLQRS